MFGYARALGVSLAPHAKTPMSPELSQRLIDRGAWGLSAANLQQAAVLLDAGFQRLLIANQIGGRAAGRHFGALLKNHPDAELMFFVDSIASLDAVGEAAAIAGWTLPVLIEVGRGRAGARDLDAVTAMIAHAASMPLICLAGVAAYEGAVAQADAAATRRAIADLDQLALDAFAAVRAAAPDAPLILTAGGSSFFDLVVEDLLPTVKADGNAEFVLRSGAIYFHDHGVYQRALSALDERYGFAPVTGQAASEAFVPAVKIWAEVLSRPELGLVICGMGMRDVASDQDLPLPLALYRDGTEIGRRPGQVVKLNDQHAFVRVDPHTDIAVGDVIAFGISHPCTCFDRWRILFGRNPDGAIVAAYPTHFG
jgi:D-serine dehydratase